MTFHFHEIAAPNKSVRNDKVLSCARNENSFGVYLYMKNAPSTLMFRQCLLMSGLWFKIQILRR